MNGNGLWNSFYRGTTALMFDEDKRKVKAKGSYTTISAFAT